jgi:hypothetical protein
MLNDLRQTPVVWVNPKCGQSAVKTIVECVAFRRKAYCAAELWTDDMLLISRYLLILSRIRTKPVRRARNVLGVTFLGSSPSCLLTTLAAMSSVEARINCWKRPKSSCGYLLLTQMSEAGGGSPLSDLSWAEFMASVHAARSP